MLLLLQWQNTRGDAESSSCLATASTAAASSGAALSFGGFGSSPAASSSAFSLASTAPKASTAAGLALATTSDAGASTLAAAQKVQMPSEIKVKAVARPFFLSGNLLYREFILHLKADLWLCQWSVSQKLGSAWNDKTVNGEAHQGSNIGPASDHGVCNLQGKVVDEIINEWNAELERRSRAFVKQAEALAQWDHHILSNRHTLLELEEQLRNVCFEPQHPACSPWHRAARCFRHRCKPAGFWKLL